MGGSGCCCTMDRSLCIKVNKSMKIVDGLCQTATAADVLRRLSHYTKPQVLLEVWNGCSRPFSPEEKVFESLEKWGHQAHRINLVMMDRDQYCNGSIIGFEVEKLRKKRKCRSKRRRYFWTVSYRKLPIRTNHRQQRCLERELKMKLKRSLSECQSEIQVLSSQLNEIMVEDLLTESELIAKMNPLLQAKYTSLTNELSKQKQLREELQKHKKELAQTIINRQQEIHSLQTKVERIQSKIKDEKMLLRSKDITVPQEIQDMKHKLEELQVHLKAKQKIMKLQSAKMQELLEMKVIYEQRLDNCTKIIQQLRTYDNVEEDLV